MSVVGGARGPERRFCGEAPCPETPSALVLAELYETWHAAEPDAGHDTKADDWRSKLSAKPKEAKPSESEHKPQDARRHPQ